MNASRTRSNGCTAVEASAITTDGDRAREARREEGAFGASPPSAAANGTSAEQKVYPPHPLFPLEPGERETRDIAFLIFWRRRADGQQEFCPERYEAREFASWDDVVRRWGGGDYRVIGQDSRRGAWVACAPRGADAWKHLDGPSRPFSCGAASPPNGVAGDADADADGASGEDIFYTSHPLFPLAPGAFETREIAYVTFWRRLPDGRPEVCPEQYEASTIASWDDVVRRWGGGDYKAVAKDSSFRFVAFYPPKGAPWIHCEGPSVPFARPRREQPAEKRKLPRLKALTAEAIALCAARSAEQAERAEREARSAEGDRSLSPEARSRKAIEGAEARGAALAHRGLVKRILRLLTARSLGSGGAL
jgi:hypothetical protein